MATAFRALIMSHKCKMLLSLTDTNLQCTVLCSSLLIHCCIVTIHEKIRPKSENVENWFNIELDPVGNDDWFWKSHVLTSKIDRGFGLF